MPTKNKKTSKTVKKSSSLPSKVSHKCSGTKACSAGDVTLHEIGSSDLFGSVVSSFYAVDDQYLCAVTKDSRVLIDRSSAPHIAKYINLWLEDQLSELTQ
jgi:hypothetical protein